MLMGKSKVFLAVIVVFSLFLFFLGLETLARAKHFEPFRYNKRDWHIPQMNEQDPVLGWILKTGTYFAPSYQSGDDFIQYTILPDGSRATSKDRRTGDYDVILLGCSFTYGWGVPDFETLGWKLGEKFSGLKIGNFGRGAYSTYQSLLVLRKLFSEGERPFILFYGLNDFHEERNIASPAWLKGLAQGSRIVRAQLPYCSLDGKGRLVERVPIHWPTFIFQEYFAFPQLLTDLFLRWRIGFYQDPGIGRKVTEKLLVEMDRLAKQNSARLVVIIMGAEEKARRHYLEYLQKKGIEVVDTRFQYEEDLSLPGDRHPNGKANSLWADQVAGYLKDHVSKFENKITDNRAIAKNT